MDIKELKNLDVLALPFLPIDKSDELPDVRCVYFVVFSGRIIYVGKSIHLPKRIKQHKSDRLWGVDCVDIHYLVCDVENRKLFDIEGMFIKRFNPIMNSKSFTGTNVPSELNYDFRLRVATGDYDEDDMDAIHELWEEAYRKREELESRLWREKNKDRQEKKEQKKQERINHRCTRVAMDVLGILYG